MGGAETHDAGTDDRRLLSDRLIGGSPPVVRLHTQIERVASRARTVLVQGESGTGKELVAREIHRTSNRGDGRFVPVDCTAVPESLFESQLFGHVRGAFTGASQSTIGLFRAADGGTLFLDEIGELPFTVQAKLLRCIQERAVVPLGQVEPISVDVRIIAATHRNLSEMVTQGVFREDLFYRMNVVTLRVPALRDRLDDIPALASHFLDELAELCEESSKHLSPPALDLLADYDWPGNVRQLYNAMEHAHVFCPGETIGPDDLPGTIRHHRNAAEVARDPRILSLAAAERELIARALRASEGNQAHAARVLQIERHRLHRKIVRYGLQSLLGRGRS